MCPFTAGLTGRTFQSRVVPAENRTHNPLQHNRTTLATRPLGRSLTIVCRPEWCSQKKSQIIDADLTRRGQMHSAGCAYRRATRGQVVTRTGLKTYNNYSLVADKSMDVEDPLYLATQYMKGGTHSAPFAVLSFPDSEPVLIRCWVDNVFPVVRWRSPGSEGEFLHHNRASLTTRPRSFRLSKTTLVSWDLQTSNQPSMSPKRQVRMPGTLIIRSKCPIH